MALTTLQNNCFRLCCLLWLAASLLCNTSCGFAKLKAKQLSLLELRESKGLAIRRSARERKIRTELSTAEKKLVSKIASASENRNWRAAKSLYSGYAGSASPVYGAALHAAFRCKEYGQGAKIYKECMTNCNIVDQPVFSLGLRIFAKLGDTARVQEIWNDALDRLDDWDEILGSARIAAAADAGDVEAAADALDKMNSTNLSIDVYHINSAMRACWGWGDKQHKAAKYFFDLLPKFRQAPTVISFTSLLGAYSTASLQEVLFAYENMKSEQIVPDSVFAETYIFCLLQADRKRDRGFSVEKLLHEKSMDRLQAARDALVDFREAGVSLNKICSEVDKTLTRMGL